MSARENLQELSGNNDDVQRARMYKDVPWCPGGRVKRSQSAR